MKTLIVLMFLGIAHAEECEVEMRHVDEKAYIHCVDEEVQRQITENPDPTLHVVIPKKEFKDTVKTVDNFNNP